MTTRKRTPGGVPATTLAGSLSAGATSLTIQDATGWPSTFPFDIIVNKVSSTLRERITVGGRTTVTLNTLTRGIDGTTAQSHSLGDTVEVCVAGQYLDDLGQFLSVTTAGDMLYFDGTNWQRLVAGSLDQFLKQGTGPAVPAWSFKGTLPIYASTAARDTAIPSPSDGQGNYQNTGDSAEGPYFYNGTSWRLPWAMPWGLVTTVAAVTANQTGITTVTDVTSLTVTWTAVANRNYRLKGFARFKQNGASGDQAVLITDNSNVVIAQTAIGVSGTLSQATHTPEEVKTFSAGSQTVKMRAQSSSTADIQASSTGRAFLYVEDVGPSGAPT